MATSSLQAGAMFFLMFLILPSWASTSCASLRSRAIGRCTTWRGATTTVVADGARRT